MFGTRDMDVIFWLCLAIVAYVYFGYPTLLAAGLLGRRKPVCRGALEPSVSIVVAAHNEDKTIAAKLHNLLALDYPRERLEILVGSDGSNDRTEQIVQDFAGAGVKLMAAPSQLGKSCIQNALVEGAMGDIVVFTDADCLLDRYAVRHLVENFCDPSVGLVTARPAYVNPQATSITENESVYLRYESWIRRQESERGLLAAASGSLFALRHSLWHPLAANTGDDFVLPLQVALQGYRNVLDPRAVVQTELTQKDAHSMFRLKVRIISKDLLGLIHNAAALNPLRTGALAIGLWSHKLLRWLVAYFLLAMLVANLLLLGETFYRAALLLQLFFYSLAFAGVFHGRRRVHLPWSVPWSFCLVNAAAFVGVLSCAAGRTRGKWQPVR